MELCLANLTSPVLDSGCQKILTPLPLSLLTPAPPSHNMGFGGNGPTQPPLPWSRANVTIPCEFGELAKLPDRVLCALVITTRNKTLSGQQY